MCLRSVGLKGFSLVFSSRISVGLFSLCNVFLSMSTHSVV